MGSRGSRPAQVPSRLCFQFGFVIVRHACVSLDTHPQHVSTGTGLRRVTLLAYLGLGNKAASLASRRPRVGVQASATRGASDKWRSP